MSVLAAAAAAAAAQNVLLILSSRIALLDCIDFDEDFLSKLVARHFGRKHKQDKPMFSDAYGIYLRENPSSLRRKFKTMVQKPFALLFVSQFGNTLL